MTPLTILIFDWDDTLLCSTFLSSQGYHLENEIKDKEVLDKLEKLQDIVVNVLENAKKFSKVNIITNAEQGWVEKSAEKYIPKVLPVLENIKIISARTKYEKIFYFQPLVWKRETFKECFEDHMKGNNCKVEPTIPEAPRCYPSYEIEDKDKDNIIPTSYELFWEKESPKHHFISIGDSEAERQAIKAIKNIYSNLHIKSIKCQDFPTPEQLMLQLELVVGCIEYICTHEGELDLMLSHEMF